MRNITVLLMLIALCISTASQVQAQDVPGTVPASALSKAPSAPQMSIKALNPTVTETGLISVSIDGCATSNSCDILVEKPAGATVRGAYLAVAATVLSSPQLISTNTLIDGTPVPAWDIVERQNIGSFGTRNAFNYWADVTGIVKPIVDAAAAGFITLELTEAASSNNQEGNGLVVIFDDPNQTRITTAVVSFGAQSTLGDSFQIGLADPFDDAAVDITMSLGISFGFLPSSPRQFSIVDVNGQRLTTSAGGQDDCEDFSPTNRCGNGRLFTIGGIGDDPANPVDPNAQPGNARDDDELYTLDNFISSGATQILVESQNPSNDDNIYIATFVIEGTAAVIGEGIILTPLEAENPVGTNHTVTARVQDDNGDPVAGRNVDFEIISGPNAGLTASATTDGSGEASWTYMGNTAGTDVIVARFVDSNGETQTSNEATKTWVGAPAMADCNDFVISNYQTLTDDIQFIDLTNVADAPIDTEGCSIISFNVFSETVIANASAALSGTVEPWATKTVFFEGDMPAGPGAFGLYEKPVPADGAPFNTDDEITGMVYLSNDMVYGVAHLTRPAYNDYYDCVYGGNGVGPFMRPFSDISSCKAPAKRASAVQGTSLRAMMRGAATSDLVQSDEQPERFALLQNYPNPFNPTTVIPFTMQENSHVSIKVYDLMGREIATLISEPMAAGQHSVEWNGRNSEGNLVPSGMYLYRMDAAGQSFTQRMTLVK